ncbi:MAG: ribosome biogenesis GTPase YlqF [Clostridia bacterium]|nr:ribosome biogenesis GTPase YlqF [Clostridia bacterium]
MIIQWYPGHMAKAKRLLQESLKLIDVVIEIVDARAPIATRNPDFDTLFQNKDRVIILNKADLADKNENKRWIEYYKANGIKAIECIATHTSKRKNEIALIEEAAKEKVERFKAKGIAKTVRAMIVGIPNVGKSTFINSIAGLNRAQVGDKPGVTKGKQWVKISPYLELMDTPGLLWPKLEDEKLARHVAFIGSVRDDILDVEELAGLLLSCLMTHCKDELCVRYKKIEDGMTESELLCAVAKSRGFILQGGIYDTERAARIVLDEFRGGKIAKITLDKVSDMNKNSEE